VADAVAAKVQDQVEMVHVDTDQNPDLAQRYQVMGIPVLIRLEGGREVGRLVGYRPASEVEAFARTPI
jgi:thioredoxin-like negative regulator of GroEL